MGSQVVRAPDSGLEALDTAVRSRGGRWTKGGAAVHIFRHALKAKYQSWQDFDVLWGPLVDLPEDNTTCLELIPELEDYSLATCNDNATSS
ncbi:hypothetical protein TNCV_166551 [Trichonephila clavipes]|nr:hypothetical protein TNCV_166551 [Trichonephila clavipes]